MKNSIKWVRYLSLILFIASICGIGYFVYNNYQQEHAGDKPQNDKVIKKVYKSFDNYDFINLKSLNVTTYAVNGDKLNIKYQGTPNLSFKLVDVYSHKEIKQFNAVGNEIIINFNDVKDLPSRYDLLTNMDAQITKLNLNTENIELKSGFGIIDNEGLELSFNKIFVDDQKEFKLFFDDLNFYRQSINLPKLKLDERINKLSQIRTKDEVDNLTYNFHYSKTTGFANVSLINAGIVQSDCGKNIGFNVNKYCNVTYEHKQFSINIHNNDFEQITRGILFAHQNIQALKDSPIHNRDLISQNKTVIGGAFKHSNNATDLIKDNIIMYGPIEDHTDQQASSAYIRNDFANGIKNIENQEHENVEFLNTAFSIFLI